MLNRPRKNGNTKQEEAHAIQLRKFTGRHNFVVEFNKLFNYQPKNSPIIWIAGSSGVGKTTLLREYQEICARNNAVVVFHVAQRSDTIINTLRQFSKDLSDKVNLRNFNKSLQKYLDIQAKIQQGGEISSGVIDLITRGIGLGLNLLPQVPAAASTLTQDVLNSTIKLIYSKLSREDAEFLLFPDEELTKSLVQDLNKQADKRIFIFIDNYERILNLHGWYEDKVLTKLATSTTVIIASRKPPKLQLGEKFVDFRYRELPNFTDDESKDYLIKKGISNQETIQDIVALSNGLPLALLLYSELALRWSITKPSIAPQKYEVLKDLVNQYVIELEKEIPLEVLEVCAVLETFNQDSLSFMLDNANSSLLYQTLRETSFVQLQYDGLSLHDTFRDVLQEDLRWRERNKFITLHKKASDYYKMKVETSEISDWLGNNQLRLGHLVLANEKDAVEALETLCSEIFQLRYFGRLDVAARLIETLASINFISDEARIKMYLLEAQLALLKTQFDIAEKIYRKLSDSANINDEIRARVLWGYGESLLRQNALVDARKKYVVAERILETSNDSKRSLLAQVLHSIGDTYRLTGSLRNSLSYYDKSLAISNNIGDWFRVGDTLHMKATALRTTAGKMNKALTVLDEAIIALNKTQNENALGWAKIHVGYIYTIQNELTQAKDFLEAGFDLVDRYRIPAYYGWGKTAWGYFYQKLKQPQKAAILFNEALDLFKDSHYIYHQLNCLNHLLELHAEQEEWDTGYETANKALQLGILLSYHDVNAKIFAYLSYFQLSRREYNLAIQSMINAFSEAKLFNKYSSESTISLLKQLVTKWKMRISDSEFLDFKANLLEPSTNLLLAKIIE